MQVSAEGSADEGEPKLRGSRHASPESFTVDTRVARHSCAGEAMPHPGWRRALPLMYCCTASPRQESNLRPAVYKLQEAGVSSVSARVRKYC